jgi:uncharacterized damage-inducible protein DinB
MTRPDLAHVPPFYQGYVNHVQEYDLMEALKHSIQKAEIIIKGIPESKGEYRYAEGKWSIKELLCHVIDAERIFAYRALRFARQDKTLLSGFEENDYAPRANAQGRSLAQILNEMKNLRTSTFDLFTSFTDDMLKQTGKANNTETSVLNLGYIIAGHMMHHLHILQSRYLS